MIIIHQDNVAGFAGGSIHYWQFDPTSQDRLSSTSGPPPMSDPEPQSDNVFQIGDGNGFSQFRYDTLDGHDIVDNSGYFNIYDDALDLDVGDTIIVVVWATAIRTGTILSYGQHIVNSVDDVTGDVDLSNVTAFVITDTD